MISLTKQFFKASVAVRFIVLFLEGTFIKLLHAIRTNKVFRMELLVHGCDASACDGLVASRTEGTSDSMVVNLTVRDALVIEKAATIKGLSALL